MATLKDPTRDALFRDLRAFRRAPGRPSVRRMSGLLDLTEALGEGIASRAFEALGRYRQEHGSDPASDVGAYFYLAGWGVGLDTIDQRRDRYAGEFHCDRSTAWRRAERGLAQLCDLIRDHAERSRPLAVVSVFQSGPAFQPVLDFHLGYESWRPPVVQIDGQQLPALDFSVRPEPDDPGRYTSRLVLPETSLDIAVGFGEPMARLRVIWAMPVWPVWNVLSWTADSRILTRMRTFRERAVEVALVWWAQPPADQHDEGIARDGGTWAMRNGAGSGSQLS